MSTLASKSIRYVSQSIKNTLHQPFIIGWVIAMTVSFVVREFV